MMGMSELLKYYNKNTWSNHRGIYIFIPILVALLQLKLRSRLWNVANKILFQITYNLSHIFIHLLFIVRDKSIAF